MTRYKRNIIITLLILVSLFPPGYAKGPSEIREKALDLAKPLEAVMIDGPFYAGDEGYYVADFVKPDSTVAASLVYSQSKKAFTAEEDVIQKVLATKDLKKLTAADPLFFGLGDPQQLIDASRFETQNVRNFAGYSSITPEENNILEIFLQDYEEVMQGVAATSRITQDMLYPDEALSVTYEKDPPTMDIHLKNNDDGNHFSYEKFTELISSYEDLLHTYKRLSADLDAFAGGLPEYPPGAIIREKWEVQITKEGLLEEVQLIDDNGRRLEEEIALRREVLNYGYDDQITEAQNRLGVSIPERSEGLFTRLISALKNIFLGLFGMIGLFYLNREGRQPPGIIPALIVFMLLLTTIPPTLTADNQSMVVPTMDEVLNQKVGPGDIVEFVNNARGLNDTTAQDLIKGFRLFYRGESVEIEGPYNYYGKPYYFFDIQRNGGSTGFGFLVDAEKYRLVGDQRQAYQLLKTLLFTDLLKEKPLYQDVDADLILRNSRNTLASPLDLFLGNLSRNIKEGKDLENEIIGEPDFEKLQNLTSHYVEAFILIRNIGALLPEDEADRLTGGFSRKSAFLDAYSRATRGLSSQEFLQGRIAQYRGRTLNRLPLISGLSGMGLRPSKAQVAHDLTSDLIHDNPYLWRGDAFVNSQLFARLSYREGTYTRPQSALEQGQG